MKEKKSKKTGKKDKASFWNLAGIAALIAAIGGIVVPIALEMIRNTSTTLSTTPEFTVTNASPTPANATAILLEEDFEEESHPGLAFKRASWRIIEDPLNAGNQILQAETWDFIHFTDSKKWKNYALDFRINFLVDNTEDISVILAFDDNELPMEGTCNEGERGNAILFNQGFIGLYHLTCPDTGKGHFWGDNALDFATPAIQTQIWHQVRLEVEEPNIRLWFDGISRIDYDLSQMNLRLYNKILRIYTKHKIQMDDIKIEGLK